MNGQLEQLPASAAACGVGPQRAPCPPSAAGSASACSSRGAGSVAGRHSALASVRGAVSPVNGSAAMGGARFVRWVLLWGIIALAAAFTERSWADDWPLGRGNPQGTGATEDALPENLELLWQVDVGGLGFDAGPIVAEGVIYAADAEGRILAVNLSDGTIRWQLKLDTGFVASPGYRDGMLFLGDYDGNFRALQASDGEQKWVYAAGMEIDASPNFYQDSVLFTSQSGALYCVQIASGELKWKYETNDQLQCSPTLAGSHTFLGGCDAHLHVVDVRSGTAAEPPIPIDAPTGSTPAIVGQDVFVPTYAGEIFRFSLGKREPVWRFRNPELAEEFKNSAAVAHGILVAASRHKRVFALNTSDGSVRWVHVLRKRSDASPVIAGHSVIIAAADGRIIRLDLESGQQIWMTELKGSFLGSPAIAGDRLVLTSDRGTIYCLGPRP
ncbi:MAG: serine/threonine protein kinase [Planctomycetota bacterium]|nr:MAG: serine/threonine protein kinase [Planctomycetota bacterium]